MISSRKLPRWIDAIHDPVRSFPKSVFEPGGMLSDSDIANQLEFHEELAEVGSLIDAAGFHPTARVGAIRGTSQMGWPCWTGPIR